MNEIPKNTPSLAQQPQKVEQVKTETIQETAAQIEEAKRKEIKKIPENPADR